MYITESQSLELMEAACFAREKIHMLEEENKRLKKENASLIESMKQLSFSKYTEV